MSSMTTSVAASSADATGEGGSDGIATEAYGDHATVAAEADEAGGAVADEEVCKSAVLASRKCLVRPKGIFL